MIVSGEFHLHYQNGMIIYLFYCKLNHAGFLQFAALLVPLYYVINNSRTVKDVKIMYKVVLVLRELQLRLKECLIDISVRKNTESLILISKAALHNGVCLIKETKEFFVDAVDPLFTIQFIIYQGHEKKYGG